MGDHVFGSGVKGAVFLLTFSGAVACLSGVGVGAEDTKPRAAFAMSIEEFRRLSPADQKAVVKGAFERRLELARNIHYESLQTGQIHKYKDGKVGAPFANLNGRRYRHWRLGDSWRIDSEKGGYDVSQPDEFAKCTFDTGAGVRRSLLSYKEMPRLFGRIDVTPNADLYENRYAFWLDGKKDGQSLGDYLIRDVIDWFDQCQLEAPADHNLVSLTIPSSARPPIWKGEMRGSRQFDLDTAKGFLPVSGKAYHEIKTPRSTIWRREEFSVLESTMVGDVWMPTRLREVSRGSAAGHQEEAAVWETSVARIEAGTVTAKDLEVPFPEGTEVTDAIQGVFYVVCLSGVGVRAEDAKPRAAFAMSIEEFRRLSPADQKAVVKGAFERRLLLARNIEYEALCIGQIHRFKDGKLGEPFFRLNGRSYRQWRLGDSWRIDSEKGGYDVSQPDEFGKCSFDAGTGMRRSTLNYKEVPRLFGRIDVTPSVDLYENRYAYWLDGKRDGQSLGDYLIRDAVDWFGSSGVEAPVGRNLALLKVPWKPIWSKEPVGTRQFDLDPAKGFLPIRGTAYREQKAPGGRSLWRYEEFLVRESAIVGDVWMPTRLREIIRTSSTAPDQACVWETAVRSIEAGTVTPQDLEVPFPEGTEVTDAIQGVFYVVGPGGRKLKQQALMRSVPPRSAAAPPASSGTRGPWRRWIIVLGNLGLVAVVGSIIVARSRRRAPASVAAGQERLFSSP